MSKFQSVSCPPFQDSILFFQIRNSLKINLDGKGSFGTFDSEIPL